ncbi:G-type lectin S-receptor-like serine/threonine-protein kinase RLK1 [Morella rubra]|uniref:G-type lectin S-receptor-like serine/threonine-protein kinase RLK1 n=1 Tax=Morella rubra TaxID=262757 RepID=A0A6A1WGG7_9ROSI|nr:G-type lectin S-receptor-like serine/threonine-protein kinase RLK1 [Morella rubra]
MTKLHLVIRYNMIICSHCNVDYNLLQEAAILEEWAFKHGELAKLLVNEEHDDQKNWEEWLKVALWCILEEPSLRPSMKKVLLMLEGTVDIPIPPSLTSLIFLVLSDPCQYFFHVDHFDLDYTRREDMRTRTRACMKNLNSGKINPAELYKKNYTNKDGVGPRKKRKKFILIPSRASMN